MLVTPQSFCGRLRRKKINNVKSFGELADYDKILPIARKYELKVFENWENCSLGQNVNVSNNVVIGDSCKIQNNVLFYEGVKLENEVFYVSSCVFTNYLTPRAEYPKGYRNYRKTLLKRVRL